MSYTIDAYRGRARAIRNIVDFACYVSMFPQLVAGPIVRFSEVADQLQNRGHTFEKFSRGVAFFALGLAKKILLANPCGKLAERGVELLLVPVPVKASIHPEELARRRIPADLPIHKPSFAVFLDQLAFDLGFPVDLLSTRGGGANETRLNLMRRARVEPDYLDGKRAVIWCFSVRPFTNTEEGWIPIPL